MNIKFDIEVVSTLSIMVTFIAMIIYDAFNGDFDFNHIIVIGLCTYILSLQKGAKW